MTKGNKENDETEKVALKRLNDGLHVIWQDHVGVNTDIWILIFQPMLLPIGDHAIFIQYHLIGDHLAKHAYPVMNASGHEIKFVLRVIKFAQSVRFSMVKHENDVFNGMER